VKVKKLACLHSVENPMKIPLLYEYFDCDLEPGSVSVLLDLHYTVSGNHGEC